MVSVPVSIGKFLINSNRKKVSIHEELKKTMRSTFDERKPIQRLFEIKFIAFKVICKVS